MINKSQIQNNLVQINRLYRRYIGDKKGLYYSKLAILEACGWIEESMDDIVLSCAKRHLVDADNFVFVKKRIVKRTTSFDYDDHFRQMLMQVLGIIAIERLESNFDQRKFTNMKSALTTLKRRRDEQAHTHIKGTTMTIDAPSVTIRHFQNVYDGLKHVESLVRRTKT